MTVKNAKEKKRPSILAATIAGSLAGMSMTSVIYPIDTYKTRLQSCEGRNKACGFRGLYKGFTTLAMGAMPINSIFFGSYEAVKQFTEPRVSPQNLPIVHMFAATVCRGLTAVVRVPVEVAKQRQQAESCKSTFTIWKEAYRQEGICRGLYRGFAPTILRDMPFSFIQMPIWEFLKRKLKKYTKRRITVFQSAFCGLVAGGVAAAVTTPLDVVKTRIMLADAQGVSYEQLRIKHVLMSVYMESGIRGLYAGIVPRTGMIMFGGFVFFGVYEELKFVIDTFLERFE